MGKIAAVAGGGAAAAGMLLSAEVQLVVFL